MYLPTSRKVSGFEEEGPGIEIISSGCGTGNCKSGDSEEAGLFITIENIK
jgi:hypothetical protein